MTGKTPITTIRPSRRLPEKYFGLGCHATPCSPFFEISIIAMAIVITLKLNASINPEVLAAASESMRSNEQSGKSTRKVINPTVNSGLVSNPLCMNSVMIPKY
mmetsp:Transcript_7119/g.13082  ORF Transcript_7119/g.13082 Transcript_7119/m.13082 type:complete len:103 (-) Transcript_7119:851-1159(-)